MEGYSQAGRLTGCNKTQPKAEKDEYKRQKKSTYRRRGGIPYQKKTSQFTCVKS